MAAPALHKTWQGGSTSGGTQFVNVLVSGTAPKDTLWAIKNAMVNLFANPWTVVGSSDGANASMDGTDRWVDSGDIVYRTNVGDPFSWIVLEQTALGATFQTILYSSSTLVADPQREDTVFQSNSGGYGVANGGATDGSTTAIPDVADSTKSFNVDGHDWIGAENGSNTQKVLTCVASTDGECFRALISQQSTGIPISGFGVEKARLPPSGWVSPVVMYLFKSTVASGLSCFRWETMADAVTDAAMRANSGDTVVTLVPQMPMFSSTEVIDLQEDDRPNPMLYPCALFGWDVTEGDRAFQSWGTLFDWYWCSRNPAGKHLLDMDSIPVGGDRSFVCIGDPVIGWLDDSATDLLYEGPPPPVASSFISSDFASGDTGALVITAPAGIQAGDVLIAGLISSGGNDPLTAVPAGWTLSMSRNDNVFEYRYIYTKIATGSEPGSYSFTFTGGGGYVGAIGCYRGGHATQPDVQANLDAGFQNFTNWVTPAVVTNFDETLVVTVCLMDKSGGGASAGPWGVPAGTVRDVDIVGVGTFRADKRISFLSEVQSTAGAYAANNILANPDAGDMAVGVVGIRALNT